MCTFRRPTVHFPSVIVILSLLFFGILPILPVQAEGEAGSGDFLWAGRMGGTGWDHGSRVLVDSNGNIYIAGSFSGTADLDPGSGTLNLTSAGMSDIFLSKLGNNGSVLWSKRVGGTGDDYGIDAALDAGGNIYLTGSFQGTVDFDPGPGTTNLTSAGADDIYILKVDNNGNFLWTKGIGGTEFDSGASISLDSTGNIYTTGSFQGTADFDTGPGTLLLTSAGQDDIFVSKLGGNGSFLWAKRMGGTSDDYGYGIAVSSGSVYITGSFRFTVDFDPGQGIFNLTSVGSDDIFISKLDGNGSFAWAKGLGALGQEEGRSVAVDVNGNVYIAGFFTGTIDFDSGANTFYMMSAGGDDFFLSKLDGSGNFIWAKRMGGPGTDHPGFSMAIDSNANIYIAGYFEDTGDFDPGAGTFNLTSMGGWDIFLSMLDGNGNFGWAKQVGGEYYDYGFGVAISQDRVYATGGFEGTADFDPGSGTSSLTSAGDNDIFLLALGTQPVHNGADTVGVFRPSNGVIFLKNSNTSGFADIALNYGLGGDYPIVGDWDGDGDDTIGVYRGNTFLLRNSNTVGFAELNFIFGEAGDQPIAGDWDGDGKDTIGVYRPKTGQFLLRNDNSSGFPDKSFYLGNVGDVGIAGDWNGDGMDTTGVFRPSNGVIFLKNTNETGFADLALNYGLAGDKPVVGDWDNNGTTTIGVYRGSRFYLRNSNTNGFANITLDLGIPGDMPIAGNWDGIP